METRLVESPILEQSHAESRLSPILEGKPVAFFIKDSSMRRKKRIGIPVVFVHPLDNFGTNTVLVSVPGYGAEVVDPATVKPLELYKAGLTMKAAKALANEMKSLFEKQ